jgi:TonB family protein
MRVQRAEIRLDRDGAPARRTIGNVVPFLRPDGGPSRIAPVVAISSDARPAPVLAERFTRARVALFLVGSLALHAALYAAFHREAPPLASVGERSISVEIVLGTDRVAGLAQTPTKTESTVDAVEAQGEAPELVKPETARQAVEMAEAAPVAEPLRASEAAPPQQVEAAIEAKPLAREAARQVQPTIEADTATATAAPPLLATTALSTETAASPPEVEQLIPEAPQVMAALPQVEVELPRPRPEPPRVAKKPPEKREVAPAQRKRPTVVRRQKKDRGEDTRTRESARSSTSVASSGIGRGRSDADTNYRGIVAARLARNKHFPPDARRNGQEGRAVVRFVIEPSGSVSSIVLAQGTGVASLDSEAQAVVRRSSPFPPPPSGRREAFRVPLTFDVR